MSNLPTPITNLSTLYATDCEVSRASNTTLTIATGQVRDSTNTYDIVSPTTLTLNAAANGANGLDTGTFAASTWYAVHLIYDWTNSNPVACLLSTSKTAPVMPSLSSTGVTYSAFRFIGWMFSNSSTHFASCYVIGNSKMRQFYFDSSVASLTGGSATSFTTVSLAASVPAEDSLLIFNEVLFTPAGAGDYTAFRPAGGGAAATATVAVSGVVAGVTQRAYVQFLSKLSGGNASYQYVNSAAGGVTTVNTLGFQHFI